MSVELFTKDLGISNQPFLQDYQEYGGRATDEVCKSLWEKLDHFHFELILGMNPFQLPSELDHWMMIAFRDIGFSRSECERLHRVHLHQQVLYKSDVFNTDGTTSNSQYLHLQKIGDKRSRYRFRKQWPRACNFTLWRDALSHLAPGGRCQNHLGKFLHPGHIIWQWRFDPGQDTLYHTSAMITTVYTKHTSTQRALHSQYSIAEHSTRDTSTLPCAP